MNIFSECLCCRDCEKVSSDADNLGDEVLLHIAITHSLID